jgi:hypothetical protein
MRRTTALAYIALTPGVAGASAPPIEVLPPPPAKTSTARLAIASGTGAQRLALWTATNTRRELCMGWRIGPSTAPPTGFTCLRRRLERPVLPVEYGGGVGVHNTWAVVVGLASPLVARVSLETGLGSRNTRDLDLRGLPGHHGWRVFTTGNVEHPPSRQLRAYGGDGALLVADGGGYIRPRTPPRCNPCPLTPPPVKGRAPAPSGPPWSDVFAKIPEKRSDERAISIALAHPAVRSILVRHAAWIDSSPGTRWMSCGGRKLGLVVVFRFVKPASFTATLPFRGRPQGRFAYSQSLETVRVSDSAEMNVTVDTNLGSVAGVDFSQYRVPPAPGAGSTTSMLTRLEVVKPPRDTGGVDAGGCPPPSTD